MNRRAPCVGAHAVAQFNQRAGARYDRISGIGFNPHGQARQRPAAGLKRRQIDLRRGDLKHKLLIAGVRGADDRQLVAVGPRIDRRSMPELDPANRAILYQPVDRRRMKLVVGCDFKKAQ